MKLDRLFFGLCIFLTVLSTWMLGCEPGTITHHCDSPYTCPLPEPRPAEESPQTPDLTATDEPTGSALIPAPAVGDEPGNSIATPTPSGCTPGEVEDWGEGGDSQIAAGPQGFAVGWDADVTRLQMVDRTGKPTSASLVVPTGASAGWPQLAYGRSGYLVSTEWPTNLMTYGQNGTLRSSVLGVYYGGGNFRVAGGETDRAMWLVFDQNSSYETWISQVVVATISDDGQAVGPRAIGVYANGGQTQTRSFNGFAAKGSSVAVGMWVDAFNGVGSDYHELNVLVDTGTYGSTKIVNLSSCLGQCYHFVHRIVATDSGFAVLWRRTTWSPSPMETHVLSFIGEDGTFRGSVAVDPAHDVAWSGSEFGLVYYNEALRTVTFRTLAPDGQALTESKTLWVGSVYWSSYPKLAASGRTFGVVWVSDGYPVNQTNLKFTTVSCQ